MRRLAGAALLLVVCSSSVAAQPAALDNDALLALAGRPPATPGPDPFSLPGRSAYDGTAFQLSLPLTAAGARWSYDPARQVLSFHVAARTYLSVAFYEDDRRLIDPAHRPAGFDLPGTERRVERGHAAMQNAFGATAEVRITETFTYGVVELAENWRHGFPAQRNALELAPYVAEVPLEPDNARAMTPRLVLRVEGVVRDWRPGSPVLCGTSFIEATLASPHQQSGEHCFVTADIERLAVVDTLTGDEIVQWGHRVTDTANVADIPLTDPVWVLAPGPGDLDRFFPPRAWERGISGQTTLSCIATVSGILSDCQVVSETPANWGFGTAAVRLTRLYRLDISSSSGQAIAGRRTELTINWEAPSR